MPFGYGEGERKEEGEKELKQARQRMKGLEKDLQILEIKETSKRQVEADKKSGNKAFDNLQKRQAKKEKKTIKAEKKIKTDIKEAEDRINGSP